MHRPTQLLRRRSVRASLVGASVVAVLVAPIATSSGGPAGAVVIGGANNLSDQVRIELAPKPAASTDVHVLAFNDFHGNLEAGGNNIYGRFAGGAAYLAKAIKDRQAMYGDRQVTVFAGDNIGASPLANGLFFEEPATIVTNLMNVDLASVGNHEFDKGAVELKRIQNGGCHPLEGCTAAPYTLADGSQTNVYPGADFQYLSANVIENATGKPLFPAFEIKSIKSGSGKKIRIGFIGEVLESTPTIVTPTGVAGLTFQDEADAANRAVKQMKNKADSYVLVIHEGGFQTAPAALNGCTGNLAGSAIADIASRLDPAIKVIVSAHTHAEYRCTITTPDGVTRLVTSASSFGRVLTDITLTIDDKTGQLVAVGAENIIVENALNAPGPGVVRQPDVTKEDPQVAGVVQQYVTASAPLANTVIGRIQGDLTRVTTPPSPLGESTLGDVIADAQLAATADPGLGDAVIAFMNPGGIRADLRVSDISSGGEAPGEVTYGEAFTVQPFGNSLVTKTMTGDMIRRLLEQQFQGCQGQILTTRVLQISVSFSYEQDPAAATCAGKIGRMFVDGVEVAPTASFRVTMNNFLAAGGDGFTVFNEGTDALGGAQDIDALVAAFAAAEPAGIAVPPLNRIVPIPTP